MALNTHRNTRIWKKASINQKLWCTTNERDQVAHRSLYQVILHEQQPVSALFLEVKVFLLWKINSFHTYRSATGIAQRRNKENPEHTRQATLSKKNTNSSYLYLPGVSHMDCHSKNLFNRDC